MQKCKTLPKPLSGNSTSSPNGKGQAFNEQKVTIKPPANGPDFKKGYTITRIDGRRTRWRVAGYTPNGDRVRKQSFKTYPTAYHFREGLIVQDENVQVRMEPKQTELSVEQLVDAEEAYRQLRKLPPCGWGHGQHWTLTAMVQLVREHFKPVRNPKLLAEATEEFFRFKEQGNLRPATLGDIHAVLSRLKKTCPGAHVHEVTLDHVRTVVMRGTTKHTKTKALGTCRAFFKWAKQAERGYCPENPTNEFTLPPIQEDPLVPHILDNPSAFLLLQKSQEFAGGCLFLYVVLGMIHALRPAEIARMEAARQFFGEDTFKFLGHESIVFSDRPEECLIHVLGKCRRRRTFEIMPGWAKVIRPYVEAGYPFVPRDFMKKWNVFRLLCGFKGGKLGVKEHHLQQAPVELVLYEPDLMRHTGLTNHLAFYGNEGETALVGGDSPKVIHGHYKGRTTKAKAKEFYEFVERLTIPSVSKLKESIPAGAREPELRKFETPIDHHTTYFLSKEKFELAIQARKTKLAASRSSTPEPSAPDERVTDHGSLLRHVRNEDLQILLKFVDTRRLAGLLKCCKRVLNKRIKRCGLRRLSKAGLRKSFGGIQLTPECRKIIEQAKRCRAREPKPLVL